MWIEHPSSLGLLRMLRETMDNAQGRIDSPTPDKVSSAADAMLKLSSSASPEPTNFMGFGTGVAHAFAQVNQGSSMGPMTSPPGKKYSHHISPLRDEDSQSSFRYSRKQREFIPENKKDDCYWAKRRKNNEAAKRSREKRRANDMAMSDKIFELSTINSHLQMELRAIKEKFGWPVERPFPFDADVCPPKPDYLCNSDSESSNISFTSGINTTTGPATTDSMKTSNNNAHGESAAHTIGVLKSKTLQHDSNSGNSARGQFTTSVPLQENRCHDTPATVSQQMPMLLPLVPPQAQGLIPSAVPPCLPHPAIEGSMQYSSDPKHSHADDSHPPPPAPLPLIYTGEGMRLPFATDFHQFAMAEKNGTHGQGDSPDDSNRSTSPELKINLSGISASSSEFSETDHIDSKSQMSENAKNMTHFGISGCPTNTESRYHPDLAQAVENSRGSGRKGVPFKLWHKIANSENQRDNFQENDQMADNDSDVQTVSSTSSHQQDGLGLANQFLDPRYLERRRRNNMAARKCRENRKHLNDIRLHKSNILETENNRLRDELKGLCTEVTNLRGLLEKKKQAHATGEPFEPPPIQEVVGDRQYLQESYDSN